MEHSCADPNTQQVALVALGGVFGNHCLTSIKKSNCTKTHTHNYLLIRFPEFIILNVPFFVKGTDKRTPTVALRQAEFYLLWQPKLAAVGDMPQ